MPRSIRIPESLWTASLEKAAAEGTTVTNVVLAALMGYVRNDEHSENDESDDRLDYQSDAYSPWTDPQSYAP
jgi:hypothetical protein